MKIANRVGRPYLVALALMGCATGSVGVSAEPTSTESDASSTLFRDIRVLDVVKGQVGEPTNVLVVGNHIAKIGNNLTAPNSAKIVEGGGRTLMPGLIDAHVHMVFNSLSQEAMLAPSLTPEAIGRAAALQAGEMLLRGFTSVRDMGGPIFPLKAAIDSGKAAGPRIWPSGGTISQTSGHGDFRLPSERSRRFFGKASRAEEMGATFIADGRDEVLTATRENLRFGASQIKLMAGGGSSSEYDPIDVTQYLPEELSAAVEAAADWGTYVTVHAYTPRAVRRAVDAGVKCIEHGQLLDEATIKLLAERGVWLSLQNLAAAPDSDPPERKAKKAIVAQGSDNAWAWAKKHNVKLAWGTDFLFRPDDNKHQNAYILKLTKWFSNAEILRKVTYENAQLLAMSGERNPYPGKLGIIEEGALADLILVNGNPLSDINIIADPARNFAVIMKNGRTVKGGQ